MNMRLPTKTTTRSAIVFRVMAYATAAVVTWLANLNTGAATPPGTHAEQTYVSIPAGAYPLGDDEGRYDERPAVTVQLSAFSLARTEVSNAEFAGFVAASGYRPQGPWRRGFAEHQARLPVRFVTWFDAAAYAAWARCRLPTEAQWEAAARLDERPPTRDELAADRGPVPVDIGDDTHPLGILHLRDNVREWTADYYDRYRNVAYAQSDEPIVDPRGPDAGTPPEPRFVASGNEAGNERSTRRVVRGASWAAVDPDWLRPSRRYGHNPAAWYDDVGFRCAR